MSKYQTSVKTVGISKMFGRGKTVVPSDARKYLGVKDGQKIVWKVENGKLTVEVA